MDTDIPITPVTSEEQVEPAIVLAKSTGRKVIVGDTITVNLAKKHGLDGILITSGEESVRTAFEQAELLGATIKQKERNQTIMTEAFTQSLQRQFILDQTGEIITKSHALMKSIAAPAFKQLSIEAQTLIKQGRTTTLIDLPEGPAQLKLTELSRENGSVWLASIHTANELFPVQMETLHTDNLSTSLILGGNEQLNQSFHTACSKRLTVIVGPSGSGENVLAKALLPKHAFACSATLLLKNEHFASTGFPLFITHMEEIAEHDQLQVLTKLVKSTTPFLLHSEKPIPDHNLDVHLIQLPSLLNREKEWEHFVRRLIAAANQSYGKQVIGYRGPLPRAIMQRFEWLTEYVFAKVKTSTEPYIYLSNEVNASISLAQPLDKIEKDIIKHVLAEEDFNQSKAAERLQINRTTLWRKLK